MIRKMAMHAGSLAALTLLAALLSTLLSAPAAAGEPVRIVWTGASFVPAGIIQLTTKMINEEGAGVTAESKQMSFGGTPLERAIEKHKLLSVIETGNFDYTVVNEIHLATKLRDEQACARAREQIGRVVQTSRRSGAEPIFFCTWLRVPTMEQSFDPFLKSYEQLAQQHHGALAPIGPAWRRAWTKESEATLQLYAADRNHASIRGEYLSACVMYAVLTGKSPVGSKVRPSPTVKRRRPLLELDEKRALLLQQAAWETFQEFRQRKDLKACVLDLAGSG